MVRYSKSSGTGRWSERTRTVGRPVRGGQVVLEERRVAQRGRHQHELGAGQLEQRDLPGPASLGVGVVVELVDDDDIGLGPGPVPQGPVGQDLGRAADDRGLRVDRRVAGDHADQVGAEVPPQGEELLRHQRLDRGGVDAALAAGQGGEVGRGGHERLARPGRRVEDHVVAVEDLEDRLLLGRVQLDADRGHEVDEPVEEQIGVGLDGQVVGDHRAPRVGAIWRRERTRVVREQRKIAWISGRGPRWDRGRCRRPPSRRRRTTRRPPARRRRRCRSPCPAPARPRRPARRRCRPR